MASSDYIGKLEADVEIKASPEEFHDMFANKPHDVHKTCNDKIKGCDLHEGEWGKVGTIVHWTYHHDGKPKKAKEVIEAIDPEKNLITFRVIEGDLMEEYKSFVITIQVSPKSNGSGSIVHWTLEYERLHDAVAHPETLLEFVQYVSKDIDAHITSPSEKYSGKLEADVEIKASPEEFHDMFSNKPHHLHKTCNGKIHGCDLHEGEWGKVGTIVNWTYHHDGKTRKAKEVIEAVDPDKNLITFRVLEGDIMEEYKSFVITIQVSGQSDGSGSIVHWTFEYERQHDAIAHPETLLELAKDVSKDIDAYLLAQ